MKTKIKLEQAIKSITTTIHREYPELSGYIIAMPVNDSEKEKINIKNLKDYYNSLEELLKTQLGKIGKASVKMPQFPGYPLYPASDDIYQKNKEEVDLNPEDPTKNKVPNEIKGSMNEKDFNDDMSGDDLDIPGSELDDLLESIGSEDEENNYYSLGGDNHNDLEEDKG